MSEPNETKPPEGEHNAKGVGSTDGLEASAADDADYEETDYEEDEWEAAMQDCGQDKDGHCSLAGSEYCEFECPFR